MNLYLVCYTDDDGDSCDWFVTERSPEAAFARWRSYTDRAAEDYGNDGREVSVFLAPQRADRPAVHEWDHPARRDFKMSFVSLTTRAIEAERNAADLAPYESELDSEPA